jgi:S-formylglutathione hydrolase FrmB
MINFNLFSQTLLALLAIISAGLTSFLITQMKTKRRVPDLLGISIIVALGVQFGFAVYLGNSADELPTQLWLMILPWAFSVNLIFGVKYARKHTKMTKKKRSRSRIIYVPVAVNITCCLLFVLVLLNGYYRYYPTFYSLIGRNQAIAAALDSNGQIILQYNADGKPITSNNSTLESSLYGSMPASTQGRLYSTPIPGKISKFKTRNAWVYVPAIASADPNALNLPVLVLLAGFPGGPTDWLHGVNLVSTMNAFAKQHHGITPIVVVPDDTGTQLNDTECVNSPRGNVETYLTQDVPNYIKAHFPVSNDPSNWAVGGLSMGGTCAVMLSLVHPNVYQTFLDMSGESGPSLNSTEQTIQVLFHGSLTDWQNHQPLYLLAHRQYTSIGGFFASGNADDPSTVSETKQLYINAKRAGLSTVYETVEGPHTFNVFAQIFKDALPWLSNRVGATTCSGSASCS